MGGERGGASSHLDEHSEEGEGQLESEEACSIGGKSAQHHGSETLQESLGSFLSQDLLEDVSDSSRVLALGCRLQARFENVGWDAHRPVGHSRESSSHESRARRQLACVAFAGELLLEVLVHGEIRRGSGDISEQSGGGSSVDRGNSSLLVQLLDDVHRSIVVNSRWSVTRGLNLEEALDSLSRHHHSSSHDASNRARIRVLQEGHLIPWVFLLDVLSDGASTEENGEERSDAHQRSCHALREGEESLLRHRLLAAVESTCEQRFLAGRRHGHRLKANLDSVEWVSDDHRAHSTDSSSHEVDRDLGHLRGRGK
ncbi:hypothetical protein PMAYCL1PPCAC_20095 [Pristionchus mayeri]|uniref:Uncharacterized protein n=1 Tax=Pristionchus mayeri TaxID=1317129 RepID=A0AAN5CT29_9BILA|nr:hypothetical protein PMAYCL1PPCAC_20095 [Pristionchus mayeri]